MYQLIEYRECAGLHAPELVGTRILGTEDDPAKFPPLIKRHLTLDNRFRPIFLWWEIKVVATR